MVNAADTVYAGLELPNAAALGKRVAKKLFFDNAALSAADRRLFTDDIETVIWQYALKPAAAGISAYHDEERDYREIAVIEVTLRRGKRTPRLADLIHRAIPYPLLLIFTHGEQFALSTAHKRASRAEHEEIVATDRQLTAWMCGNALAGIERDWLNSMNVTTTAAVHLHALFEAWHQRLLSLACARLSGHYHVPGEPAQQMARREQLADCHRIQTEIDALRRDIRAESRFNRQVELNARIKQRENQLAQIITEL